MDQIASVNFDTIKPRCCEGPGCGPLAAAWAGIAGGGVPAWPQFAGREVVLTYQGRAAVRHAAAALGVGPGDEVLMPAYHCGTEVDPWLHAGAKVVLYRVRPDLVIDAGDLAARVTPRTKVVYVIHYFGFPQELGAVRALCRERGLRLVEDCALALFSHAGATPIGTAGDAAIFSFPKTLPVPDGGALTLASGLRIAEPPRRRPPLGQTARGVLPLIKRRVLRLAESVGAYGPARGMLSRRHPVAAEAAVSRPDMPADYYFREATTSWTLSRLTAGRLGHTDPAQIVAQRRANYTQLHDALSADCDLLTPALPDGVCPLGLAILVSDRRRWLAAFADAGVSAFPWWEGCHRDLSWDAYPEAAQLKRTALLLPVHQQLPAAHMCYIAELTFRIAKRLGGGTRSGSATRA